MDMPHFLHHQSSRYVTPPPLPPPPSHHHIPEDSNFYAHHIQPPPPPLLPPSYHRPLPSTPPHPPPPTLHPSDPKQPQFTTAALDYNNRFMIEDDHRSSLFSVRDFIHSDRISFDEDRLHRSLPKSDRSFLDNRPDSRELSRVAVDNRPIRKYSHNDFELEGYHRQFDDRPISQHWTIDRNALEDNSRLRVEYDEPFPPNQREDRVWARGEENYHRLDQLGSNPNSSRADFEILTDQNQFPRDIRLSPAFDPRQNGLSFGKESFRSGKRDGLSESQRWGQHNRQYSTEVRHSLFEMGSNERRDNDCNDSRIVSGKRECYGSESGRYGRGFKESSHEYNRTPRKQVQKKSALLRIQMPKPNSKARETFDYFDDKSSGSFRGENHLSRRSEENDELEGDPVELDVSFKSNSLVAKEIVAPLSSGPALGTNLTPKNEKSKELLVPKQAPSDSPLPKLNINTTNKYGSTQIVNPSPSSVNKSKKSEDKTVAESDVDFSSPSQSSSKRKIVTALRSKVERAPKDMVLQNRGTDVAPGKTSQQSQPSSKGKNATLGKSKGEMASNDMVLQKEGTDVTPGKTSQPSQPSSKRKNVTLVKSNVERAPKDMVLQKQGAAVAPGKTSQPTLVRKKKIVRKVVKKVVNHQVRSSSSQPTKCHNENPVDLKTCLNEVNVLPVNEKVDVPIPAIESREYGFNIVSDQECLSETKRNERSSVSLLRLLYKEESRIDERNPSVDSLNDCLNSAKKCNKDKVEIPEKQHVFDIDSVECGRNLYSQKEDELLLGNASGKKNQDTICAIGGNPLSRLLCSGINTDCGLVDRDAFAADVDIAVSSGDGLIKSRQSSADCNIGVTDGISEQVFTNQVSVPPNNENLEGISATDFLLGNGAVVGLLDSKETRVQNNSICADFCDFMQCTDCGSENSDCNFSAKHKIPDRVSIEPIEAQLCVDRIAASLVNGSKEGSPKATASAKTSQGDMSMKRSDVKTHLDEKYVEPVNVVDTALSRILKDFKSEEVEVSDVGYGKGLSDELYNSKYVVGSDCNSYLNEILPKCNKKRKVIFSSWNLPCAGANSIEGSESSSASGPQGSLTSKLELTQQEEEVSTSKNDLLFELTMIPPLKRASLLIDNSTHTEASGNLDAVRNFQNPDANSCSTLLKSIIPNFLPLISTSGNGPKENANRTIATNEMENMGVDSSKEEKMEAQPLEDQFMILDESAQRGRPSETLSPGLEQGSPITDQDSDHHLRQGNFYCVPNLLTLSPNDSGFYTTNSGDEVVGRALDKLLDTDSPGTTDVLEVDMLSGKVDGTSMLEIESKMSDPPSISQSTNTNLNLGNANKGDSKFAGELVALPSKESKRTIQDLNLFSEADKKIQLHNTATRTFPGQLSSTYTSKKLAPSIRSAKSRTWHRTGNSSVRPLPKNMPSRSTLPFQGQLHMQNGKVQSASYIRKGNSLVRKSAPVAPLLLGSHGQNLSICQSNTVGLDEGMNIEKSECEVDVVDNPNDCNAGGTDTPVDRPRTPPLPRDCTMSPLVEPLRSDYCRNASDVLKSTETNDRSRSAENSLKISETLDNKIVLAKKTVNPTELDDCYVDSSNREQIVYVKRKSNQLIATSNPLDLSIHKSDKSQTMSSEGYYKRNRNQLIRASLGGNLKHKLLSADDVHRISKDVSGRRSTKRRLRKGITKAYKSSRYSLVWTLSGSKSPLNDKGSQQHKKIVPRLFPWKRAYWRSFIHNTASVLSSNSSLSTISKKLLLLRKRDTLYTRSNNGFSLRKSKVLSVGGSSLKWSKSIEKCSKEANEEATRAVAAVERRKREQNGAPSLSIRTKGERIFRIGSFSYKMDPSKRTLQRISDDDSSCSTAPKSGKSSKKSYVPRRLMIGNDEYVRIGNGNQLVRNPKKRARMLASEKVRWSLHTARQRLARKHKYCQFFTRFGKCNKNHGKCPYIHDPSKIAVCTKFLNGLCSDFNCKLTHKVIPERMPDCSYYLQGLCTNRDCAYRHVNVNPEASTCEGFLKGYCADGNECRKKHSYVCPIFEATGTCPQGSRCKLHHPKKLGKGRKRKRSLRGQKKNARGRYFGSMQIDVPDPATSAPERHSAQNNNLLLQEELADFISLGVSDEEVEEMDDAVSEQKLLCSSDESDLELDDLDELFKPVFIMNDNSTA